MRHLGIDPRNEIHFIILTNYIYENENNVNVSGFRLID